MTSNHCLLSPDFKNTLYPDTHLAEALHQQLRLLHSCDCLLHDREGRRVQAAVQAASSKVLADMRQQRQGLMCGSAFRFGMRIQSRHATFRKYAEMTKHRSTHRRQHVSGRGSSRSRSRRAAADEVGRLLARRAEPIADGGG